jgi:hemoglobin-like flavoprotein
MVLKKIAEQAQEKAAGVSAAAQEKIDALIDEFNAMLPFAEQLGLSVTSFHIEAGLLPQIKTSLVGSIENIKDEAIQSLIAEHEANKLLVALLNAVLMAKRIHQRLEGAYISILKDIVIDIKLGLPPSISCRFQ